MNEIHTHKPTFANFFIYCAVCARTVCARTVCSVGAKGGPLEACVTTRKATARREQKKPEKRIK